MKTLALLVGPLVLVSVAFAAAEKEGKTPTIKQVMALNKGPKSPLAQLKTQLGSGSPDWDAIRKNSKEFVTLSAALAKNTPPKGDEQSWKKLSDLYYENSKSLDDAAEAHDKAAAVAAHAKLSTSCKACHSVHRK